MEVKAPDRARHALALIALTAALVGCGKASSQPEDGSGAAAAAAGEVVLTPETAREGRERLREQEAAGARTKARVVELRGAGTPSDSDSDRYADAPSPGAPTDAEVRAELREARAALADFRKHLNTTAFLATGPRARVLPDGTAVAPENAPDIVKRVILAANEIAKFPYKWGGGHGAWRDNGYDCSGSVSFALAGAGLLGSPLTSRRLPELRRARSGQVDHDLHEPRSRLHDRGGAALRHERPGPRRHALAGGVGLDGRVRRAPRPGALARS